MPYSQFVTNVTKAKKNRAGEKKNGRLCFYNCASGSETGWVGYRWPWPKPALWQAGFLNKVRFFHEGDVGRNGFMVAVNLNHGYAIKSEGVQLVDADIAPLVINESCDIAKGDSLIRVVLREKPCTWSKGVKEFHDKYWRVFEFLRTHRVIAHFFGDDV